ncbi:MAG: CCA tRNA nucleotidyltransferase, partial [Leptospiraceae bacterium]|nr:CCA tRNA nucleotidyltransferase [Leptospiraceae bacterium]
MEAIHSLCTGLRDAGHECYLVGGAVRDLLMGRAVLDFDFATDARPEQVQRRFKKTIPTGIKHGTVSVLINSHRFEVTTYRGEASYTDGRHPDAVFFSDSLSEDLRRRDFTINALAYDPESRTVIDEHDGLIDLENRLIRTIGAPRDRFYEDALRPVRACRFAATLDFDIDPETESALADRDVHRRTRLIAVERFTEELWKGFRARHVESMIRHLEKSGLLYIFFPAHFGLVPETTPGCFADLLEMADCDPTLKMARWWDDLGFNEPRSVSGMGQSLRFSRQQVRDIDWFCRYFSFQREMRAVFESDFNPHPARISAPVSMNLFPVDAAALDQFLQDNMIKYEIRRFLSGLKEIYRAESVAFLDKLRTLAINLVPIDFLIRIVTQDPITIRDLAVNGRDLMRLGF